jgi:hypothetical protein
MMVQTKFRGRQLQHRMTCLLFTNRRTTADILRIAQYRGPYVLPDWKRRAR